MPPRYVTAWSETKRLFEWAQDGRSTVTSETIRHRLDLGWKPEDAISRPLAVRARRPVAWAGETKDAREWAQDERCQVTSKTLWLRVRGGWDPGKAITTPAPLRKLKAWGQTKTFSDWLADPRCVVDRWTFTTRLQRGWDVERAVSESPSRTLVTAWGEAKTVTEWAQDPRCSVPDELVKTRLLAGWEPEDAIGMPKSSRTQKKNLVMCEAWGETKPLVDWGDDPRCSVSLSTLRRRLRDGWEPEEAIGGRKRTAKDLGARRPGE